MFRNVRMIALAMFLSVVSIGTSAEYGLKVGSAELKSAGALAFGPDGVLFVADSVSKSIYALDTKDTKSPQPVSKIEKLDEQIASTLGVAADQILINDLKVNPATGRVFLSVARGKGPDAAAVIVKISDDGKPAVLDLKKIGFSSIKIADDSEKVANLVTSLSFFKGNVVVSGLTSQEWASTLKSIPFPFTTADKGAGVEIFHGAHGKYETKAPIQTFTTYDIAGETNILASYVCTPLVKIPLTAVKAGEKVKGKTVAELGNRNRPLDIITYKKDGKDFALISNSARGVMKVSLEGIEKAEEITAKVNGEKAGLKYDSIKELDGTVQLDKVSDDKAVVLKKADKNFTLEIITLP